MSNVTYWTVSKFSYAAFGQLKLFSRGQIYIPAIFRNAAFIRVCHPGPSPAEIVDQVAVEALADLHFRFLASGPLPPAAGTS
jgi:hypothetical protein